MISRHAQPSVRLTVEDYRMLFAGVRNGAVMSVALLLAIVVSAQAQSGSRASPGSGSGAAAQASTPAAPAQTEARTPASTLVTLEVKATRLRRVLSEIARQSGAHLYYSKYVVPLDRLVSVNVQRATATEALEKALDGTGVGIHAWSSGQIILERIESPSHASRVSRLAGLKGHVTDGKTGAVIAGAQVTIEGTSRGATTDNDGAYQITSPPPGEHVVTARRIGYAPQSLHVTIGADTTATLDFALQLSVDVFDQVVVTGTVAPTEVRAVPTPITVVTANDIARLGITDITQIFRGSVPGAVAVDAGTHDGYPGLSFRGGLDFSQGYSDAATKVYVDGVEMAYTNALSQIDPNTIDHIEITRGPQASTLYGAGAMAGVVQVFTKKGSGGLTHPEITVQAAAGGLQSQWSEATAHQDHSLGITGGDGALSYATHVSYTSTGEWAPEYKSQRAVYSGNVSSTVGALHLELSGQYSHRVYDLAPLDPPFVNQIRDGHWHTGADAFFTTPFYPDEARTDGTYGLNLTYQTTSWWTNRLLLGYDGYDNPRGQTQPRLTSPSDTMRTYGEFQRSRASVGYNSSIETKLGSALASTLTIGIDHWQTHETALSASEHADGTFASGATLIKYLYANTGLFAQEQLGIANALFITAGVRGDRNDNFGGGYGTAVAPRVGVSYAGSAGNQVSYKVRASYGTAIQAPLPLQKSANTLNLPFSEQLANPELGPERQSGYDAGVELYFGKRASVQATYYNQRVDDLISSVTVSAPGDTLTIFRNANVGRIKNTGWEFQGATSFGRLSVIGTYSIFNSIVQKGDPGVLGDGSGQYHIGDRLLLIPRSSGGITAALAAGRTQVSGGLTYIGSFRNYDEIAYFGDLFGGASSGEPARSFIIDYPSNVKLNAQVGRDITRSVNVFLRVDNLTNSYQSEINNISAVYGRLTVLGVKARW
jgi:outer membrane receptor protein involved in Fe transport